MGQKEKKKKKEKEEKKPDELIPIGNYPVKQWRPPLESMKQDFTQHITLFIAVSQSYLVISLKVTCAVCIRHGLLFVGYRLLIYSANDSVGSNQL